MTHHLYRDTVLVIKDPNCTAGSVCTPTVRIHRADFLLEQGKGLQTLAQACGCGQHLPRGSRPTDGTIKSSETQGSKWSAVQAVQDRKAYQLRSSQNPPIAAATWHSGRAQDLGLEAQNHSTSLNLLLAVSNENLRREHLFFKGHNSLASLPLTPNSLFF